MTDKTHWKRRVTQERIKQLLAYDPATGVFLWMQNRRSVRAGDQAGTINNHGYIAIKVDGILYTAHRLAWLWMTGEFPSTEIDHINRVRPDNRFENLRLASSRENKINTGLRSDNITGFRGVSFCTEREKFVAQISHEGKQMNLGRYSTLDGAKAAYAAAAARLHGRTE